MLEMIRLEVVEKNRWLNNEEFLDLFSIAQSLPGVFAVNISIFIGYRLERFRGAVLCAIAATLPSFVIILIIALFATQIKENAVVESIFKGLRPAVVALIFAPCLTIWKALKLGWKRLWIPSLVAISVAYFGVSPVTIVLVSAFCGYFYFQLLTQYIKR